MIFYGETYSDQLAIIFIVFFTIKKNQLKENVCQTYKSYTILTLIQKLGQLLLLYKS